MFDANNMPILCQFVSARYRATAYGIMNMCGVFAGATITSLLGESDGCRTFGTRFCVACYTGICYAGHFGHLSAT